VPHDPGATAGGGVMSKAEAFPESAADTVEAMRDYIDALEQALIAAADEQPAARSLGWWARSYADIIDRARRAAPPA
jgi:hypothetical protein